MTHEQALTYVDNWRKLRDEVLAPVDRIIPDPYDPMGKMWGAGEELKSLIRTEMDIMEGVVDPVTLEPKS